MAFVKGYASMVVAYYLCDRHGVTLIGGSAVRFEFAASFRYHIRWNQGAGK